MTIDLAAAIAAQQAEWEAERAARQAAERADTAARQAARAAKREEVLRQYLGEELIAQLNPLLDDEDRFVYTITFDGVVYGIRLSGGEADLWAYGYGSVCGFHSPETFIVALATLHPAVQAERAAQAEREAQRAAQLGTHARLLAIVDAAKDAYQSWQWPEGRVIAAYLWRWSTAPSADGSEAEYDGGWSYRECLPQVALPVHLEADSLHVRPRELYLSAHTMPVVSVHTFRRFSDLPAELREREEITVPDITHDYHTPDADGDPILVEQDDAVLTVGVGYRPVAWVRALLD